MYPVVWQVGKNFNPEAADFNLEVVFSLGLHNLSEFVGDLSTNANKELGIEQASLPPGLPFEFPCGGDDDGVVLQLYSNIRRNDNNRKDHTRKFY